MNKIINISSNEIDIELQIKLLEYLRVNKDINDDMYNYVINKLLKKLNT